MNKNIRLIAADMDGTLLNSHSLLSDGTVSAIHQAQAHGITFAVCTGRYLENAQILLRDAGVDCPVIALNGCIVQAGMDRVHTAFMAQQAVAALYEAFERVHAPYYLFGPGSVVIRRADHRHHSEISYAERLKEEWGVVFSKGKEAALTASRKKQFKFFVYQDALAGCTLNEAMKAAARVPDIAFTRSSNSSFEVMPLGVNKREGLERLAAHLRIPMGEVMAIGDHENDVPMLKAAGLGVAMGNAAMAARAAADEVTDDNDSEGAAKAIIRFALR